MERERLYDFQLNFSKYMVRMRGDGSDYKRLNHVREEALKNGYASLLKKHSSLAGPKAAKLLPFPSSRRG